MKVSGIYKFVNNVNGKVYIGSSFDLMKRCQDHLYGHRPSKLLRSALEKYGILNFEYSILELVHKDRFPDTASFAKFLYEREQFYLDSYFAQEFISTNGKDKRFRELTYNLNPTAKGAGGLKWSEEAKARRREQYKIEGHTCLGRVMSEETREKIRTHHKENGTSVGENNPNYGKKASDETKAKTRAAWVKNGRVRPFIAIDSSEEVVGAFMTTGECSKKLDVWKCQIKRCLSGVYKTAGGYKFRYVQIGDNISLDESDVELLKQAGYGIEHLD